MRFIMIVKATADSEAGVMPPPGLFEAMAKFNQEMIDAGVMLSGEGVQSSKDGARVTFGPGGTTVTRGPFPNPSELLSGFWIIQCASQDEAIAWARRVPFPHQEGGGVIEIRKIMDAEDFGDALPADVAAHEDRMRAQIEAKELEAKELEAKA